VVGIYHLILGLVGLLGISMIHGNGMSLFLVEDYIEFSSWCCLIVHFLRVLHVCMFMCFRENPSG
jgi:hypothetical protein